MKDYVQTDITLTPWSQDMADFIAAMLADIGYESFTHDQPVVSAFILKDNFTDEALNTVIAEFPAPGVTLKAENSTVEGEDWNHEWEKNYFKPISVDGRCVVRSTFHAEFPDAEYQIIVDPKMAFGTGHHATTRLMLKYLLEHDLLNNTIIDMGTGTGILAILSCLRGCKEVYGIEIDPDAYANACDNAVLNNVKPNLICGDASRLALLPDADILLANINRNIIVADLARYRQKIRRGGKFVCSGFYLPDLSIIEAEANKHDMKLLEYAVDNDWVRAEFSVS